VNAIESFAQSHLFYTGHNILSFVEGRKGFPMYPTDDEFRKVTKEDVDKWCDEYGKVHDSLSWVWRELFGFARWLSDMESNLSCLTVSAFWRKVYIPYPHLLFNLLFNTVMIFLFGTLWGPAYSYRIRKWWNRG
jgi:hypothetical protein